MRARCVRRPCSDLAACGPVRLLPDAARRYSDDAQNDRFDRLAPGLRQLSASRRAVAEGLAVSATPHSRPRCTSNHIQSHRLARSRCALPGCLRLFSAAHCVRPCLVSQTDSAQGSQSRRETDCLTITRLHKCPQHDRERTDANELQTRRANRARLHDIRCKISSEMPRTGRTCVWSPYWQRVRRATARAMRRRRPLGLPDGTSGT